MENWDYKLPEIESWFELQTDWNQTLITKFNSLSVGVHEKTHIKVPNKFKPLVETLSFYDSENLTIGNKYNVEFIDSDDEIIIVGDKELEIKNF